MKVPKRSKRTKNSETKSQEWEKNKCRSFASTEEVRALLSDLSTRSLGDREFFYELLKRAADRATSTDFAVDPADSHQTSTS